MSTTRTFEKAAEASDERHEARIRSLWIVALIAAIVVGGVLVAWLAFAGDEEPTVTFDGSTATYNGPTTRDAGAMTIRLENTHDEAVAFGWALLSDETITVDEARAWAETSPGEPPPFVIEYRTIASVLPNEVVEVDSSLVVGATYMVYAGPSTVTGRWEHPAGRIEVADPTS